MAAEPESLATVEPLDVHVRRHAFDRLIMLSDGVFAIAVTLAALEIRLPEDATSLADLWQRVHFAVLAYVFSFLVIATFWIGNRDLFARLQRADAIITALALGMLCFVALIPASTHVLYAASENLATFRFYALTMMIAGLCNFAMWLYASLRPGMMREGVPVRYRRARTATAAMLPCIFALVLVVPSHLILNVLVPLMIVFIIVRRGVIPLLERRAAAH